MPLFITEHVQEGVAFSEQQKLEQQQLPKDKKLFRVGSLMGLLVSGSSRLLGPLVSKTRVRRQRDTRERNEGDGPG